MSVSIGELDSEFAVEGPAETTAAAAESSGWAEQEKHDAQERRAHQLRARTTAWGFHD
ncbi:hypothetical protein AB0L70_35815 [Kribbella sp. NPDC051952]|uniref:hypothetical protein n=1 Tax=Kribbella sp. NPDC051952 TaxID=3154851 RepID=UPI0034370749